MMKLIDRIKAWFIKKPIQGPEAGSVFRPIFRRVNNGSKIKNEIDNG